MEMENLKFKNKENAKKFIEKMESEIKRAVPFTSRPKGSAQGDTFHITDKDRADWVVKKVLAIEDEIARLEKQHQRRVRQLQREKEFFKIRFGAELEGFVRANLNGRKKSIDLPHGRAGFRKSQETIEIIDQDAACDWAKENCPDALRKKEWTIKTPLIEHLKEYGELPDGCEHKPSEDKFYIS